MNAAWSTKLNKAITAQEYKVKSHGYVQCIDPVCRVSVIHVQGSDQRQPYFKTTGHAESQHNKECGFFEKLDPLESLEKAKEYEGLIQSGTERYIIELNLNRMDPDRKYREEEHEEEEDSGEEGQKEKKDDEKDKKTSRCQSVRSVLKLLTQHTPDELSSIYFNVPNRGIIALSSLITTPDVAHHYLWEKEDDNHYFVMGKIKQVIRREKVFYIPFYPVNEIEFSLVVFQKYFPYFTYKDENLRDRYCLVYGKLKKNEFRQSTEMVVKSSDYLAIFGKRKK